jgi:hypothetical protein
MGLSFTILRESESKVNKFYFLISFKSSCKNIIRRCESLLKSSQKGKNVYQGFLRCDLISERGVEIVAKCWGKIRKTFQPGKTTNTNTQEKGPYVRGIKVV